VPYKSTAYKAFIRSARWQRLRARHLQANPLCARCEAKGGATIATEVHHVMPCGEDPQLQMDPNNLESLCRECHGPLKGNDSRGYSREIGLDGYYIDPRHPSNRPRARLTYGRDATRHAKQKAPT